MKILYLITKSNWGGAQKYVYDLALMAKERGLIVAVALGGEGELKIKLEKEGVKVIALPRLERDLKLGADFLTFLDLIKIFKREKPDIIHLNSSKIGGLGALAGRMAQVPKIIFTIHGWAFNEQRFIISRWLIALSHWLTILLAHQAIAVAEILAKQISVLPGVKNKIKTIHNGIKPLDFLPRLEARQKLDPNNNAPIWLGTIAELHQNKGLDILLSAGEKVLRHIPGLNLIIIGAGEERDNLARSIAAKKITSNVRLLGRVPEAAQYLSSFDLFILPSRTEALPTVILEAGLAGLPVVATKVGGIPEIIENGVSGILVPKDRPLELAIAIEKILTNRDLARSLGQALKQKIISQFTEQEMFNQTFALYQSNN